MKLPVGLGLPNILKDSLGRHVIIFNSKLKLLSKFMETFMNYHHVKYLIVFYPKKSKQNFKGL